MGKAVEEYAWCRVRPWLDHISPRKPLVICNTERWLAAVSVALGIVEGYTNELASKAIKMTGLVRIWKEKNSYESWMREELEKGNIAYASVEG